jgi:hypothetical protein
LENTGLEKAVKEGFIYSSMDSSTLEGSASELDRVLWPLLLHQLLPLVSEDLQPLLDIEITQATQQFSKSAPSLDAVIDALIPTLRDSDNPIPIPFYRGRDLQQTLPPIVPKCSSSGKGDPKGKSLAWSRGLGMELSPIKTRSGHKKTWTDYSY